MAGNDMAEETQEESKNPNKEEESTHTGDVKTLVDISASMLQKKLKTDQLQSTDEHETAGSSEPESPRTRRGGKKKSSITSYSCKACSYFTKIKGNYQRHITTHSEHLFQCKDCGRKFHDRYEFSGHAEICKSGLLCHKCGKSFRSRQALRSHNQIQHEDKFLFACKLCDKKCITKNQYLGHMNRHNKTKMKCECGRGFTFPNDFTAHKKTCDGKTSTPTTMAYQCDICGDIFARSGSLNDHRRGVHLDEDKTGNYRCSKCNKGYKWRSSLAYHQTRCPGISVETLEHITLVVDQSGRNADILTDDQGNPIVLATSDVTDVPIVLTTLPESITK